MKARRFLPAKVTRQVVGRSIALSMRATVHFVVPRSDLNVAALASANVSDQNGSPPKQLNGIGSPLVGSSAASAVAALASAATIKARRRVIRAICVLPRTAF